MDVVAAILVTAAALLGALLVLLQLPGIWLALLVALLCQWWRADLFSWWTLGAVALVAALAEIADFAASALGAAGAKGTRSGVWGALAGSIIGLVAGAVLIPVPILGSVVGAIVGAGLGALAAERGIAHRPWREATAVGWGAAVGKVLSTIVKVGFALVAAVLLIAGAWIP